MEITRAKEIRRKDVVTDGIHLRYTLNYTEVTGELDGLNTVFSLEVSLFESGEWETEFLEDISRNHIEALRLFELFVNGTVTPCTARYIMEDLLS